MPDRASLFRLSVFQGYHLVTLEHKNLQCMVNITIGRVPRFGKANPLEAHLIIGGPGFIQIKIRHKFRKKSRYSSCSSGRKIIKSQCPDNHHLRRPYCICPDILSISLYSIFKDAKFRSISRIFKKNTAIFQNRHFRALGS